METIVDTIIHVKNNILSFLINLLESIKGNNLPDIFLEESNNSFPQGDIKIL